MVGDRIGENIQMPGEMYSKLINDLATIDYEGSFVFASYNEPLYDRIVLDRLRETRALLPQARRMTYTNGDYLSADYIDELADAGLQFMHISIHTKRGETFTRDYAHARIAEIARRAGLDYVVENENDNAIIVRFKYDNMEIVSRAFDFDVIGEDRGGLLPHLSSRKPRTSPCSYIFHHLHIGFNGNVVPCCHIRSDVSEHAKHVLGNLANAKSVFEIWSGKRAAAWRAGLVHDKEKSGPCRYCKAGQVSHAPGVVARMQDAYATHVVQDAATQ